MMDEYDFDAAWGLYKHLLAEPGSAANDARLDALWDEMRTEAQCARSDAR